jgi:NAD-dependent dihydropyrimidine dehydrogenase PreA subunit
VAKRKIIEIDEDKCIGCEICVASCPQWALKIMDDYASLISESLCDGLGACVEECSEEAISVIEREAEKYDEKKVLENIADKGENTVKSHLEHLRSRGQTEYYKQAMEYLKEKGIENPEGPEEESTGGGRPEPDPKCPGLKVLEKLEKEEEAIRSPEKRDGAGLEQWPIQIMLVPEKAPYFKNADLLVSADCVPFSYPDFHKDFLEGKVLLIGCPKFNDAVLFRDKLSEIIKSNSINSITVLYMEVPSCFSLVKLVKDAVKMSGKDIKFETVEIGIGGDIKSRK